MNTASFLLYCFIVTFTPGPTNIMILSTLKSSGTRQALRYVYGATLAFGLLLVLSAMLNTALATILPRLLPVMRVLGTLYMLYLTYKILQNGHEKDTSETTGSLRAGFLMQFLNPKVVLFTATVIPSFVLPYYTSVHSVVWAVASVTLIGSLAFASWLGFGTLFKTFLQKHDTATKLVMALLLLYATAMIWI
ncbi:LysE family translocator [Saccharibacillus endophyticus]|uniref:Amino acid transporter LysE n=1 Tax=Saccharibacillus endophyticus TaxID=2060666 RepID=A0ABQ1ZM37_9BACL|nr:LysE family transporter [Saccharibacillus endophyticus]GGH68751.1 amino acid transporter LysE [Saccharibacillus endophyticus]